jgi:hypothetical protein
MPSERTLAFHSRPPAGKALLRRRKYGPHMNTKPAQLHCERASVIIKVTAMLADGGNEGGRVDCA